MTDEIERWLDEALSAPPPAAPAGFTARVMVRVAATAQERPMLTIESFPLAPALPWWVRAAFEPASVLATIVAAILLWRGAAISVVVASLARELAAWVSPMPSAAPAWFQSTTLAAAALAAAPVIVLLSQQLYRWSSDLVGPRSIAIRTR